MPTYSFLHPAMCNFFKITSPPIAFKQHFTINSLLTVKSKIKTRFKCIIVRKRMCKFEIAAILVLPNYMLQIAKTKTDSIYLCLTHCRSKHCVRLGNFRREKETEHKIKLFNSKFT